MSEKAILKVLRDFGLKETEAEVYLFLAKSCVQKAIDVATGMKMQKAQVYRILKDLVKRGMIEQTFESPMRFTAIPFENLLDLLIRTKREEASSLENEKDDLIAYWKSILVDEPLTLMEKFMVVEGRRNVYSRIFRMLEGVENEFLVLTTTLGAIRGDLAGLLEAGIAKAIEKQDVCARVLTPITKENFKIIKQFTERVSIRNLNIEWRHVNLVSKLFPRFVIKDEEEVIFFITPKEDLSVNSREDTGLWTNSKAFVYAQKAFFEELWRTGMNVADRIQQIEKAN